MSEDKALAVGLWRRMRRRIARPSLSLDMVAEARDTLTAVDPDTSAYLWTHRAVLGPWLASAVAAGDLAERLVAWLHRNNQFLYATAETRDALTQVYAETLAAGAEAVAQARCEADLAVAQGALLVDHHDRLGQALKAAFGARLLDTVCAEYSPALQLAVLHLTSLEAPVLDVGCGAGGALVAHLRAAGLEAVGLDRDAAAPATLMGDWLTQDYGRDAWGTVVSHLGLSLHFLHHHLAEHDLAFDYAKAYRRILASLKVGGRFAYAPALPFIEAVLGEGYRVERWVASVGGVALPIESAATVTRLA